MNSILNVESISTIYGIYKTKAMDKFKYIIVMKIDISYIFCLIQ